MIQFQLDVVKTPSGFFKLCEIALTIISLSICEGTDNFIYGKTRSQELFCFGVLMLSMVVTPLIFYTFLVGYIRDLQKTPLEILFNIILTCCMIAAGSILIHTYCTEPAMAFSFADSGKTAGSFCIINAMFYGVDNFFARQGRAAAQN